MRNDLLPCPLSAPFSTHTREFLLRLLRDSHDAFPLRLPLSLRREHLRQRNSILNLLLECADLFGARSGLLEECNGVDESIDAWRNIVGHELVEDGRDGRDGIGWQRGRFPLDFEETSSRAENVGWRSGMTRKERRVEFFRRGGGGNEC